VSWLDPLACEQALRVAGAANTNYGFANLRDSSILCTPHHATVIHSSLDFPCPHLTIVHSMINRSRANQQKLIGRQALQDLGQIRTPVIRHLPIAAKRVIGQPGYGAFRLRRETMASPINLCAAHSTAVTTLSRAYSAELVATDEWARCVMGCRIGWMAVACRAGGQVARDRRLAGSWSR
jgi:hypothetical protein